MTGRRIPRRELPTLLDAHREAMLGCRACGHHRDVVPIASGARMPRAMIVGQAPGITEAGGGKPFAGQAGRTLFRWFERAGFDERTIREEVYIAALTRCYPGRAPSGRGDRVPSPEELDRWNAGPVKKFRKKLAPYVFVNAVILVAADALGLESLTDVFSELVSYIPSVIAAIVIILVGIVLGGFVGGLIMASAGAMHGGPALSRLSATRSSSNRSTR